MKHPPFGMALPELARGLLPMSRNLGSAWVPALRPRHPAHVSWAITSACQLRCRHCVVDWQAGELPHAQRLAIARKLADSKIWSVALIGGEPLVVRQLPEYLAILKQRQKTITISTNGLLLDEYVEPFVELGIDHLNLSFESHLPEVQDALRGAPGLFARHLAALERIRALRRNGRPRLQVRGVIHRENLESMEEYVRFWEERADDVALQVIQQNEFHQVRDQRLLFQPEDRPRFEEVMARLQERFPRFRGRPYSLLAPYTFDKAKLRSELSFRCLIFPNTGLAVMPDGSLRLCFGHLAPELGNILERELDEVWNDPATDRHRERIGLGTEGCICWEGLFFGNLALLPLRGLLGLRRVPGLRRRRERVR